MVEAEERAEVSKNEAKRLQAALHESTKEKSSLANDLEILRSVCGLIKVLDTDPFHELFFLLSLEAFSFFILFHCFFWEL